MKGKLLFKISCLFMFTLFSFISHNAFSQNVEIKGTIIDSANGTTLVGVNVVQKGTTNGVVSDFSGKYSVSVPKGSTVVFSYIGYSTQEIIAESSQTISIKLKSTQVDLGEFIVIGYATQKKTDKTGAVAMVKASELNAGSLSDPIQAMQGKTAGVTITKGGGDPNGGFAVRIRGASGYAASTQPLFVVDGIAGVDPSIISPNDIESYNVLKDAASTAIYGSRGANGVIIITTKNGAFGKKGDMINRVEYNSQVSFQKIAKKVDLLSADQIRSFAKQIGDTTFRDGGANTDWQDEIYRKGISYSNDLNLSGGNSNTSYYASLGRYNWEGIMKGTSKDRTNAKINISHNALDGRLNFTGGITTSFENNKYQSYGGWGKTDIIYQALSRNPTDPVFNSDGTYNESSRVFNYQNPINIIDNIINNRDDRKTLGNFRAQYDIFKGFSAAANFGYIADNSNNTYFTPSGLVNNGFASKTFNTNNEKLMELTATYATTYNIKHNVNLLGGYSYQEKNNEGFYLQARDAQSPSTSPYNMQTMNDVQWGDINSWKSQSKLIGFFGRAQYNYDSKYYVSASIRRDGSTRFGANKKWGLFPTAAISWNLDREDFIKKISWISQLKFRASIGVSGNQEIGDYHSIQGWQVTGHPINPETGQNIVAFNPLWNANENLQWEQTVEKNVGFDFAFFDNKLSGTFDAFWKLTSDLLGQYQVPVPPNVTQYVWANSGSISNVGQELFLQYFAINKRNLEWKTSISLSHIKTKVENLGDYQPDGTIRHEGNFSSRGLVGSELYTIGIMAGEELGSFYLPKYVTLQDGKVVYESKDGGYTTDISSAKRTIIGSALPKIEIGWSNYFKLYKRWSVDMSFRALLGNKIYNATKSIFDNTGNIPNLNGNPDALDWYDKGRESGSYIADIYMESASFLRLDYFGISYDFKLTKAQKWITGLKASISANNLFTLTNYSGVDPETTLNGTNFGVDCFNVYPKARTLSIGLKATF